MTENEYKRMTEQNLRGRQVRTLRELRNGLSIIPPNTICTIEGKSGGLGLKTEPCEVCGVSVRISKVQPRDVELLEEPIAPRFSEYREGVLVKSCGDGRFGIVYTHPDFTGRIDVFLGDGLVEHNTDCELWDIIAFNRDRKIPACFSELVTAQKNMETYHHIKGRLTY